VKPFYVLSFVIFLSIFQQAQQITTSVSMYLMTALLRLRPRPQLRLGKKRQPADVRHPGFSGLRFDPHAFYQLGELMAQVPGISWQSPCAADCLGEGWLHHSRDGRYVFVGDSGDVISTTTRTVVGYLPAMYNSRKMIEIDWQNGVPVWAMYNRSSIGQVF